MTQLRSHESLPMYAVSEELAPRIEEFALESNLKELEAVGYTVLRDVPVDLTDRIRAAILRLNHDEPSAVPGSCAVLLGRDPVFAEAVVYEPLLALVEYMCGRGALLGQLLGSVRGEGSGPLPLHADQNWLPAPFPEHNTMLTACWVTDEFTEEGGATRVVPGSHRLRRHPSPEESEAAGGAIAIECPTGSIALWDGSVWHGNLARRIPGERVVLHATYNRLAYRPVEDYAHLGEDFLDSQPLIMATLLGRRDFFGTATSQSGGVDWERYVSTRSDSRR